MDCSTWRSSAACWLIVLSLALILAAALGAALTPWVPSRLWPDEVFEDVRDEVFMGCGFLIAVVLATGTVLGALPYGRLNAVVPLAFACAAYLVHTLVYWDFIVDDAGITFTYARHLAEGHGLVFNVGGERVEGYSNFAWMLLLTVPSLAGSCPMLASKLLGILTTLVAIIYLWRLQVGLDPAGSNRLGFSLGMIASAGSTAVVVWTTSGLENGLTVLSTTALLWHCWRFRSAPRSRRVHAVVASCWSLILALNRPEGVLAFGAVAALVVYDAYSGRVTRRQALLYIAPCGLMLIVFTAWRYAYFGYIFPNPAYAKLGGSLQGILNVRRNPGWSQLAHAAIRNVLVVGLVSALLFCRHGPRKSGLLGPLAVVIGANVAFHIVAGGDWMGQHRYLTPSLFMAYPVAFISLEWSVKRLWGSVRDRRRCGALAATAFGILVVAAQAPQTLDMVTRPPTQFKYVRRRAQLFKAIADRLGVRRPSVLDHDAGGTSYDGLLYVIDSGLLNDAMLARNKYDQDVIRRYVFEAHAPTFVFNGARHFLGRWGIDADELKSFGYIPLWTLRSTLEASGTVWPGSSAGAEDFWFNSYILADCLGGGRFSMRARSVER